MKYKIEKGHPLFDQIQELKKRGEEANEAACAWIVNYFGEEKKWARSSRAIWGGIEAIELDSKPEGWKSVGESWQDLYAPKANLKAIWKEWDGLPIVKEVELKQLFNYGNYCGTSGGGLAISHIPGVYFFEDYILVSVPNFVTTYQPVDGMVEILESEFNRLKETVKSEPA